MNIKFERNGVVKETHEKFTDDLKAVGWSIVGEQEIVSPRDALKAKADELGLEYKGNISNVDLKALVEGGE